MFPVQITLRDISPSSSLEELIHKKAEKLHRLFERITNCKIVIEAVQKNQHQGKQYSIHLELDVPGKLLVVTHKKDVDVYVVLRDSFTALERQLEEYVEKRMGYVKSHEQSMKGKVARILSDEGYGFILGMDGNEYYFSVTNVAHPNFEQLTIGDAVAYIPTMVNDGRQAHHVIRE